MLFEWLALIAAARTPAEPPQIVYTCRLHATEFAWTNPGAGVLTLEKRFAEDGRALGLIVQWEDTRSTFVARHRADDMIIATLQWPGEHRLFGAGRPFDWADGSIRISLYGASGWPRAGRGERWRQTFVDRDGSLSIFTHPDGSRSLMPNLFDLNVASDVHELSSPARLHAGLDALIAWGRGARRLTVYETLVTRRRPPRNTSPSHPLGRRRIIGSYDVDVEALALLVGRIRRETESWESRLADYRTSCERGEEHSGEIILT